MRPRTLRLALAKATTTTLTALGAAILALGLGLAGCSDDEGGGTPTLPVVGEDTALIRFAHFSPDAGTVDIVVNEGRSGSFTIDDVDFGVVSRFFEIPATFDGASVNVKVRASGGADAIDTTVEILRGTVQTVAVVGKVTPTLPEDADALRATVITNTVDPRAAEATISFVHAAPSVAPVVVTQAGIASPPLFSETAFGEAASVIVRVPRDDYALEIRPADTGDLALAFPPVTLENGRIYTVWAVETPEGGLQAIVSIDAVDESSPTSPTLDLLPESASIRVAHLSYKAPAVQVLVDGAIVSGLENVSYPAISGRIDVLAATHRVQVFDAADDPFAEDATALIDATLSLPASSTTTVTAITQPGAQGVALSQIYSWNGTPPAAGNVLVRFLHTSDYNLAMKLILDDGTTEYETAASPTGGPVSGFIEIPAGTYDLSGFVTATNFVIISSEGEVFEDGGVYTVYFIGDPTPPIAAGANPALLVDRIPTDD